MWAAHAAVSIAACTSMILGHWADTPLLDVRCDWFGSKNFSGSPKQSLSNVS
jgi:hypothetical protein